MSHIFRREKTKRLIGDDLIRAQDIASEFWEVGGLSASGSLSQPVQVLAAEGATAFLGAGSFSQPIEVIAATAHNLTTSGILTQPIQNLLGEGSTAYKVSGELSQTVASMGASGYETYLASLAHTQPTQILASDGKQTFVGEIAFSQGVPTLTLYANETQLGNISIEQFIQSLSGEVTAAHCIIGVTKDSNRVPIGGCEVKLFRSYDDTFIEKKVSNADGSFTFILQDFTSMYYIVAYRTGAPDLVGASVNTLVAK
jgi:hypothetical protein